MTIKDLQKTMDKNTIILISKFNHKYQNLRFELHKMSPDNTIISISTGEIYNNIPILTIELIDNFE